MLDLQTIKVLEFEEIKSIIAQKAYSDLGKEEIMALFPFKHHDEIIKMQDKVRQIIRVIEEGGMLPLSGLKNLSKIFYAASKEALLSISDLQDVSRNLQITTQLKKHLKFWDHLPFVSVIIENLVLFPHLQQMLSRSIDKKGFILDSASPELGYIRDNIKALEEKIHNKILKIFKDTNYQRMFQDQIITIREGRFVIPIKHEYRGVFEGLVQDSSGSGATVFMEPIEIIEMNNELKEAKLEEKKEIEQIIRNLSLMIGRSSADLKKNLKMMGHLDMVGAIATYTKEKKGILPEIFSTGHLKLIKARHPLLEEKAIPIDVEIGNDFNTLIITGPNTGGKTVTLKTIGLFALMGLSGMPILADEGSHIPLFNNIFADIGDEQSITQNLSTFSSHMSQIVKILHNIDANSLVLLDELGAGTDPKEGTAIGISLLEYLGNLGARTIITTHYGELKYFASTFPGARNAAMEFDTETLLPSYRIVIGLPGRSCALSIARRLGLPDNILRRAEELLTGDHITLDKLLEDLKEKDKRMHQEYTILEKSKIEIQELINRYEEALHFIETEKTEVLTQAASEADILIHSSRSEIKKILKEFKKRMNELSKSTKVSKEDAEILSKEASSKLDTILERLEDFKKKKSIASSFEYNHNISVGATVSIPSLNKEGEVIDIKDDQLIIQIEKVKMTLPYWQVKYLPKREHKKVQEVTGQDRSTADMPERLNLIGLHVDEALYKLEKYIDNAIMADLKSFCIVHGKGTGALRKAIHQFLKKHKAVGQFRIGESHEGSWGVTVVILN